MSITDLFFKPIKEVKYENLQDYEFATQSLKMLISTSRIIESGIYVIDYRKRSFAYVSPYPLFLCGYNAKEVQELGFEFFPLVTSPGNLEMLLEINEKGFEFFYNLPVAEREKCFISFDFNLIHKNGQVTMINQRLKPLNITAEGDMAFAVCHVEHSTNTTPGNVFIQMLEPCKRYNYSFTTKKFIEEETPELSVREKQVLKLMVPERSTFKISSLLFISENTVKQHKKEIYKKLNVNSRKDAIFYANIKKII